MNLKEIREIISLMNDNDLTEIELEREGTKIKIKKTGAIESFSVRAQEQAPVQTVPSASTTESTQEVKPHAEEIKSPMVGTFYRSPSPDASPFIDVGQIVEVGQVVCIVEAMKLMNEIKSEVRGRVTQIPVENAEPVEFGQTLFVLEAV